MSILLFFLGLIIGSFLNCLIYRLETNQGFVFGGSFCPSCRHNLAWKDLIPVLSFVLLKGKCRYCQKRISIRYPLVELATGILFVFIFWHWNLDIGIGHWNLLDFVYLLFISSFLIVIFVFDLKHYLIPDKIVYSGIVVALLYRLFEVCLPAVALAKAGKLGHWSLIGNWKLVIENFYPLFNSLAVAFLVVLFFFAIYHFSHGRAMGFGDVKLAFFMSLFLGFPKIAVALFFAFFTGALTGLGLMILKKKTLKSELPFGPFLASGTLFALFWGEQIFNLYINLWAF